MVEFSSLCIFLMLMMMVCLPRVFSVSGECKSVVRGLDWSPDGTRLLSLSDTGTVHVWRMKVRTGRENDLRGELLGDCISQPPLP